MRYIILLLILAGISCNKLLDEPETDPSIVTPPPTPTTITITADKISLVFDINSSPDTITINAPGEWEAEFLHNGSYSDFYIRTSRIENAPDKLVVSPTQQLTDGVDLHYVIRVKLKDNVDTNSLYIPMARLAVAKDGLVMGGESTEELKAVMWTQNGYIAVGYTSSSQGDGAGNRGGKDFWIVKFDDFGKIVWSKTYGGSGDDVANTFVGYVNGYLVGGYTYSNDFDVTGNHGSKDAWLITIDTLGNLISQQTSGTSGDDEITKIFSGSEGKIITGIKNGDQWLTSYTHSGNVEWEKTFGSSSEDLAGEVIQGDFDDFSNFYFTGSGRNADGDVSDKPTSTTNDAWLVKTDGDGNVLWKSYIGGQGDDRGIAILPGSTGKMKLFGTTSSGDIFPEFSGDRNLFMAEFDTNNGALLSKKIIKHTDDDDLTGVSTTKSQQILLAGSGRRPNFQGNVNDATDGSIVVIDRDGNVLQSRLFGGDKSDRINAIIYGRGYQKVIVGTSSSYPTQLDDDGGNGWFNWLEFR